MSADLKHSVGIGNTVYGSLSLCGNLIYYRIGTKHASYALTSGSCHAHGCKFNLAKTLPDRIKSVADSRLRIAGGAQILVIEQLTAVGYYYKVSACRTDINAE